MFKDWVSFVENQKARDEAAYSGLSLFQHVSKCSKCHGLSKYQYENHFGFFGAEVMKRTCNDCGFVWYERIYNEG